MNRQTEKIQMAIAWLEADFNRLKPLLAKTPRRHRQIRDVQRQIRERELTLVYGAKTSMRTCIWRIIPS